MTKQLPDPIDADAVHRTLVAKLRHRGGVSLAARADRALTELIGARNAAAFRA
jgi:hypothetical protein